MGAIHDDVAEFALLLTRLKGRTDRSYAALARRLGMHASTLHRYCVGEAVPLDFAGIERFAALCGASREERVELHRQWILAVAARQRQRPSDARRPDAPRPPTPPDTSTAVASSARASHSSPADEMSEPASPAVPHPGPTSPVLRRPRARSSRRRAVRSTALAVSLVALLAGLTTSAAGPLSGTGGSPALADATPEHSAPAAHNDAGPRENPLSAGTVPAAPKPSASSTQAGGRPLNKRGSTGATPPRAPFTWTADSQLWQRECAHDYVIAKPPQQVPPPPTPQDAPGWAASQGAVHGRTTDLRITVQGRDDSAVVLEALHVRVVSRITPAARRGIAYSMYEGCGAVLVPRHFSVNLDAPRVLARSMPGNDPDRPAPAIDFPYQVSLRDPEVLLLSARTESCTCDWYLDLDWSSQGRTGTMRIDDHGRPFRTTAIESLPHYWYRKPAGWVPMTVAPEEADTGG